MKITLFLPSFEISFKVETFNHYGEGFYCFTTKEKIAKELVNAIGHRNLYAQNITNTYTIGREIKFKIE